jgi:hypothetical protein
MTICRRACSSSIPSPLTFSLRGVNVPGTAFSHFQQDIGRARAIVAHADPLPHGTAWAPARPRASRARRGAAEPFLDWSSGV